MRLITLERCRTDVRLGKSIYHENGKVLLAKGTLMTAGLLERLKDFNVFTIYIEDDLSEGIEIVESIPEFLRTEAVNIITDGLDTLSTLSPEKSNLHAMIKSERAIRSFQKIFKDIVSCLSENKVALNLLASTKIHEDHVYSHSLNVAIYACQLAIENGLPLRKIEEIGLGAMLHDIGKMYIPKEVLNKPEKLTTEEFEQIKIHSELGYDILKKIHEIPLTVAHCALQHHERLDGLGYPRGLRGNEIHEYAKILSVADVFDAVTSHRIYRPAMLPHKGIELLYSGIGTQFESKQVEMFRNCIAIYPPGLTVKLNDGRTGIVSKYNFNSVGRPEIRIIKDEEGKAVTPYEMNLSDKSNLTFHIVEADALL
ncbi:HD-GYP domain-containing protein [Metabacillus fastidiosus]|uniref:HD-GYP domain-containing protein n=1 Tax=Metabacillus fastidiosus TaxID=1458 RepID=A0ABU6NRX6_9BACI|nr:HD-GYP domain-containing protein [Metabacillus fastidiosus]MED4399900.1 HD-GYP domain-containing protein [Metabacillus fastidiosus]MED4452240.1 HD-GYP domain-containing protein [Metabacillus fastidiosus]MED4462383.1 HD-GYP domain-containing protein [Metabacillus fastidiosus]